MGQRSAPSPTRRAQHSRQAALTGFGLLLAATASAEGPACLTAAEIVPARAFVGQQLLYRLEILTREDVRSVDWITPPTFPGFRSERLPGRPQHAVVEREGTTYRAREEQRALFAERPGDHVVLLGGIRCEIGRDDATRAVEASIPEARVAIRALPEAGSPTPANGLVGPVALRTRIEPRRLALGGSVHLEVSLQGAGNLWDAPDPLPADALPGAEVFRRRPELRLEPGSVLTARRIFRYDIVPASPGELTIPPIAIDSFDPSESTYLRVAAEGAVVEVTARPVAPPAAPRSSAASPPGDEPGSGIGWSGLLAGVLALVSAGALVRLRRRRRPSAAQKALASLRASLRTPGESSVDADSLARALRAALAGRLPETSRSLDDQLAAGLVPHEIAEAAALLVALDRARFDPDAAPPDPSAVERALEKLG